MDISEGIETPARKAIRLKLTNYFAQIPEYPAEIRSGTPEIPKKELTIDKVSSILFSQTNPIFFKYTQRTHIDLLFLWAGPGTAANTTTCNDFCCHAGYHLGASFNVGVFQIDNVLKNKGLSHAWVPANSGATPKCGDVFLNKNRTHMGVSLDYFRGGWWTIEAGQGGPSQGYDAIKRKIGQFNPVGLSGWVDMEKLLSKEVGVPDWLVGWWIIYEGVQPYFYYFGADFKVSYGTVKPQGGTNPLTWAVETVPFTMPNTDEVSIAWEGGTLETLKRAPDTMPGIMEKLVGVTRPPYGLPSELRGVRF